MKLMEVRRIILTSGGVSRLCMYSSAAHISLRQGCRDAGTPECCIISNNISRKKPLVNEVNYYCRFYIDYKISSNYFEAMI